MTTLRTQSHLGLEVYVPDELPDAWICTVLVAEDDDDLRAAIAAILESDGFATLRAASAPEALAILKADRPDFVLLDLNIGEMNGLDFLKLKAADRRLDSIPVIAMSANPKAAVPRGAAGLLHKPFNLDEFRCVIDARRELGQTGT